AGPALGRLGQHTSGDVAAAECGARTLVANKPGQHAHQVAGAAAVVEQAEATAAQSLLAPHQPARLDGDELVGRVAHQALDAVVEPAIVSRGVLVELRSHRSPPTMSRIMNSGRPLL